MVMPGVLKPFLVVSQRQTRLVEELQKGSQCSLRRDQISADSVARFCEKGTLHGLLIHYLCWAVYTPDLPAVVGIAESPIITIEPSIDGIGC